MITMTALQIATINAAKLGPGKECGLLRGQCEDGLVCIQVGLLPIFTACMQVAAPGGYCDEPIGLKDSHVCPSGFTCENQGTQWGVAGRCQPVAKKGETCNEDTDKGNQHVCEDGLVCIQTSPGKRTCSKIAPPGGYCDEPLSHSIQVCEQQ